MCKLFCEIAVGCTFHHNGNEWIKRSSRTARMTQYPNLGTYYFKQVSWVSLGFTKE